MRMESLMKLPNIGKVLAQKIERIEVYSREDLIALGSEQAMIKMATLESDDACVNMRYAFEGAIQNIRWHHLSKERKQELKALFHSIRQSINS